MKHDMTEGSIRGHILRMVMFMLTGLVIQTLYSIIDIYWVSRLGKEAVAAVAVSTNLMFVSLAAGQMLGVGAVALVSQAAGRKDEKQVQWLFNQSQCLSVCIALVFLVACLGIKDFYAERLAGDAATAALASEFLSAFIPALALGFTMNGLGSALRGIGDMKPGMIAQTLSVLLNMVLAPFLIFGWIGGHPLGVFGAALATLVSTLAAVLGLAIYLARGKTYLRVNFADWKPDWAVWGRMIGIGLPAGAEFIVMSLVLGVIFWVIRGFGPEAQAGFGIASRIMQAGFMPAVALSFSAAAVVGQNLGARRYDRVKETFWESVKLTVIFMLGFTVLCHIAPAAMVRFFSADPQVVEVGAEYLRIVSYNYVASGLIFVAAGFFQGLGNTLPSLIASASRVPVFVGVVLWLSGQPGFTLHQCWLVSVCSTALQMVLSLLLLRREMRRKLQGPPPDTLAAEAAAG